MSNSDMVLRIEKCCLASGDGSWDYARENAAEIDALWQRCSAINPAIFNGQIHLLQSFSVENGTFTGHFLRADFKSYLHWRECGFPETGVRDCFGSALIRSGAGHVLLGRQRAGNVNAGQVYMPGGFIDPRDVSALGVIDIDGSIARELREETGLDADALPVLPGYYLTLAGPLISIAREYRIAGDVDEVASSIRAYIGADPASELVDAVVVRRLDDIAGREDEMPEFTRMLLESLLSGRI